FIILATYLLVRTRIGNWIFAVGGNPGSARAVGVPVKWVKIGLFMAVGFMAWFNGMHQLYSFNTIQAGQGVGNEFLYIIAAVIRALEGISLRVKAGEITCVLGDNGAGKSTLIKIISGLHQQTEGTLRVDGEEVRFGSPREALRHGIATVYQDLAVVSLMEVW